MVKGLALAFGVPALAIAGGALGAYLSDFREPRAVSPIVPLLPPYGVGQTIDIGELTKRTPAGCIIVILPDCESCAVNRVKSIDLGSPKNPKPIFVVADGAKVDWNKYHLPFEPTERFTARSFPGKFKDSTFVNAPYVLDLDRAGKVIQVVVPGGK